MFLDHPKISATNADTEPDRLERLNRVYGYAVGQADYTDNVDFIRKLVRIHDHKGSLVILWRAAPTEEEKQFFLYAWRSLIGDESSSVEHEIENP